MTPSSSKFEELRPFIPADVLEAFNKAEDAVRKLGPRPSAVAVKSKFYTVDKKDLLLMIGCVTSLIFTKFSIDNLKTCEVINSASKDSCNPYILKAILGVFAAAGTALALVDPNKDVPYPYVYVKNKA